MSLASFLAGQRRLIELLQIIGERGRVYQEQLVKEGHWNRTTTTQILGKLYLKKLVDYEVEFCGGQGTRKWVTLTSKGRKLLKHLAEAEEVLREP